MIETILGNKTVLRIIRFLYLNPNLFQSVTEIYKYTQLGKKSLELSLRKLEIYGFVLTEEKRSKRYKLNLNNHSLLLLLSIFELEKEKFQVIEPLYLEKLSDFVNDCVKEFPQKVDIVLFGSKAKGKAHEYSDTDIAIFFEVKPKSVEMKMEKIIEKYSSLKIQYHIFNKDILNRKDKPSIINSIEREGIPLTKI